jgi:hypothetical protein
MKYKDWCVHCANKETWHCNECLSITKYFGSLTRNRPSMFIVPEGHETIPSFIFGMASLVIAILIVIIFMINMYYN